MIETTLPEELALVIWVRRLAADGELRELRHRLRLSQAEMSRACGVSVGTISRWESGQRRPRGKRALTFARIIAGLTTAEIPPPPRVLSPPPGNVWRKRHDLWRTQRPKNGPAAFWWQERFG